MSQTAIKVDHVSKLYKLYKKPSDRFKEALSISKKKRHTEHFALEDISFSVEKGECVGVIGTNGAGKSTILKIITGVLAPTSGNVTIDGRISALLELGAGFNQEYTGLENVYLNGTMIGFTKDEIDARLQDILDFADIGEYIYQPVKTYSSGMFVRLAFAVAINIDPEILIVDEALSVGDVFFQAKCYHKFEEFKKAGKTILFVTHDLNSIMKYCDRVVLLNKGHMEADGSPKEMVDLYKKILTGNVGAGNRQQQMVEGETDMKQSLTINDTAEKYGSAKATITDFAVMDYEGRVTNTIEKGTNFTIMMKVTFNEDIKEPIFAYTIKDMRGTEITGTNTLLERVEISPQKKGDVRVIRFTQKMSLQGGHYLLSLGCTGYVNGELTVYHRLYDICDISVIADKITVGYYDMDSAVEVE